MRKTSQNQLLALVVILLQILIVVVIVFGILSFVLPGREIIIHEAEARELVELLPELKRICSCESSWSGKADDEPRQFNPDGTLRRGRWSPNDVGMCQINTEVHGEYAKHLRLDLAEEQGNIIFANILFTEQGSRPWNYSKKCWNG